MHPRGIPTGRTLQAGALAVVATTPPLLLANHLGVFTLNFARVLGAGVISDGLSARALGWGLHALAGVGGALGYAPVLRRVTRRRRMRVGAWMGAGQTVGSLALLAVLPAVHPRRREAGLHRFSPLAYGPLTMPALLLGHVVYGAVIGWWMGRSARALIPAPAPGAAAAAA